VCVLKQRTVFTIVVFLSMGWVSGLAQASGESYVIGRITGTYQHLPGYFYQNPDFITSGRVDEVEFPGFRLLRVEDGKRFLTRPNHEGYFYQELPGGEYTLTRKRNDRPHYKEPKTIDILSFTVDPGTLVNLGTVNIILDSKPRESLSSFQYMTTGSYTYRYSYQREPDEGAYSAPWNWFAKKKSEVAADFGEQIVRVSTAPTDEKDGSQLVLKEIVPRSER
jgi:hypothetical protein